MNSKLKKIVEFEVTKLQFNYSRFCKTFSLRLLLKTYWFTSQRS